MTTQKKKQEADLLQQQQQLVARCRPIFSGQDPRAIGAALAELTAIWLSGHRPAEIHETLLDDLVTTTRNLARVYSIRPGERQ